LHALARSFLAGSAEPDEIVRRAGVVLGREWRWLLPVARRYSESFHKTPRPRLATVVGFISNDSGFKNAWYRLGDRIAVRSLIAGPQTMLPVPAAAAWNLPPIESVADLAAWFNATVSELEWYADLKDLNRRQRDPRLTHYCYRQQIKKSGNIRLIEAPKQHLRQMQRRILAEILNRVPAHPCAHGFVKGRSIRSFAAPHVAQAMVLRMDIEDFFPSFAARRIQAFFRTLGYPEPVADLLGGLCTNTVAFRSWRSPSMDMIPSRFNEARRLYARPHLPQGAPTSPALANLCSYRLDCRLAGLAQSAGAVYTRYADDLAFSGDRDFAARCERFATSVAAILGESGFAVNHHKTRIMRPGVSQRLVGLITNRHLNVPREEFDRLKATLVNCIRRGWQSQNREGRSDFRSHLSGRVSFVESINAARGVRLRSLFQQIEW
jgi:retron-type reverse transcriptase